MMCRVTAQSAANPFREAVSPAPDRPPAPLRRLVLSSRRWVRTAKHRASRWFIASIADVARERRFLEDGGVLLPYARPHSSTAGTRRGDSKGN